MIDLRSIASLVLWLWRSLHAKSFKRDWAARDATGIVISPGSLTRTAERNASANPETSISWLFGQVMVLSRDSMPPKGMTSTSMPSTRKWWAPPRVGFIELVRHSTSDQEFTATAMSTSLVARWGGDPT